MAARLSRRTALALGLTAPFAAAGATASLSVLAAAPRSRLPGLAGATAVVDDALLPSPDQVYADNATMVGFGPRITGSRAHNAFIGWLHDQFERNGCTVLPYDTFPCHLWEAQKYALTILDGAHAGEVPVAAYYPRGGETAPGGHVAPLVYAGAAPALSFSGDVSDPAGLVATLRQWEAQAGGWLQAAVARLGSSADGAILLVDTEMPPALTLAAVGAIVGAYYIQGGPLQLARPWKKLWLTNVTGPSPLTQTGGKPAGVVYIVDASHAALAGQYVPFDSGYAGMPALYVDRDAGARLRDAAGATPRVRFTMTATKTATTSPSLVAVMPGDGTTQDVLITNTHSDGTNFVEENGTLGLVELARYFHAQRRQGRGPRRSIVFSCVTGHFNGDPSFPQTQGFIDHHPDLIVRATAALTVEHLGVTEWRDDTHGYYSIGEAEPGVLYVDESLATLVLDSFMQHTIPNTSLARSRANLYFGVGGALQSAGVPSLSFLTGPTYLCQTAANGCLDKLDPQLMRRQVAWFADMLQRIDATTPKTAGSPGGPGSPGTGAAPPTGAVAAGAAANQGLPDTGPGPSVDDLPLSLMLAAGVTAAVVRRARRHLAD